LAPLATAYPSMNVCQIHNSWEQYDNYLVSSLYSVLLLALICQIQWSQSRCLSWPPIVY
jgi:hypothetical protein